tara:strand:+ start:4814 stop:5323 length:510 start_codon:yes stop_codon:yes gene_type:complete
VPSNQELRTLYEQKNQFKMPLYGSQEQRDASHYFDIKCMNARKYDIPENIYDYGKLIKETKKSIELMDSIYEELEDANPLLKEYIIKHIQYEYVNDSNEMTLFEAGEYYIYHMDGYYVDTVDGNSREWIYAVEIDQEYYKLKKYINDLESKFNDKIVLIGLEIALLRTL